MAGAGGGGPRAGTGGELLVVEPLPQGDQFRLLQPLEDETEVRREAFRALHAAATLGLRMVREEFYDSAGGRAGLAGRARTLSRRESGARERRWRGVEPELERLFATLGEPAADGRVVHPADAPQPAASRPVSGVLVRLAASEADRQACFAIRIAVFVEEQGVALREELDEHDAAATQLLAVEDGRPLGTSAGACRRRARPRSSGWRCCARHAASAWAVS